jgi:hypothetical protein
MMILAAVTAEHLVDPQLACRSASLLCSCRVSSSSNSGSNFWPKSNSTVNEIGAPLSLLSYALMSFVQHQGDVQLSLQQQFSVMLLFPFSKQGFRSFLANASLHNPSAQLPCRQNSNQIQYVVHICRATMAVDSKIGYTCIASSICVGLEWSSQR